MKLGVLVFSWVVRHAFALVLIILMLIVARYAAAPAADWFGAQTRALRTVPAQQATYAEVSRDFQAYARRRALEADAATAALARSADEQLRARRQALAGLAAAQRAAQLEPAQLALAAARRDTDAVLRHYRAQAEAALLERERRAIEALLSERRLLDLEEQRRAAAEQLRSSHSDWIAANARAERLDSRFLAGPRDAFCEVSPLDVGCENHRALVAARADMKAALAANTAARRRITAIDEARRGAAQAAAAVETAETVLAGQQDALARDVARLEAQARSSLLIQGRKMVVEVLGAALLILAAAILAPVLFKALLFFWVAPLASRRPAIRLLASDEGRVEIAAMSAVSQKVVLGPGEELLVVPQALQSTPHEAEKRTRWLLSWAMPLSSVASGMYALTEIRVSRRDSVLVSATGGPVAEIALIALGTDSALVLRPRALRGLLKPSAEPVRITRRWRLGLSAWLTLQFRYLIFHGPCTLVVEGARGVRLEQAGPGRGISQAATIGFSAGLAYAVSRSETFGAYLMGKQALFNDSFASRDGVYLHEEMPAEGRKGGIWAGGLRGLGDAALKIVGL